MRVNVIGEHPFLDKGVVYNIMTAVLKVEDKTIQNIYFCLFTFTIVKIIEAMLRGENSLLPASTLPHFLINSTLGFGLFWSNEYATRHLDLSNNTEPAKRKRRMVSIGRYTGLGVIFYFLFKSLITSTGIIFGIFVISINYIAYFVVNRSQSKLGEKNNRFKVKMFDLASHGLIVILAICIGYFGGSWIGGSVYSIEFSSIIGLALGIVATIVIGLRVHKQRMTVQQIYETKEDCY
ncbi:hypothetical protein JT359_18635 [Candidatus Poribacteria bacterium]|nr:hypothetical protein [Candidatus Poribacteria bacterium]